MSSTTKPVASFHDLMQGINDHSTILDAGTSTLKQIRQNLPDNPPTTEEFAAAIESQIIISAITCTIQQMRNPSMYDETHHAE